MQLYQKSNSGSDFSSETSLKVMQPSQAAGKVNGSVITTDQEEIAHIGAHPFLNGDPIGDFQPEEGPDIISHTTASKELQRKSVVSGDPRIKIQMQGKSNDGRGKSNSGLESYHETLDTIIKVFQSEQGLKDGQVVVVSPKNKEHLVQGCDIEDKELRKRREWIMQYRQEYNGKIPEGLDKFYENDKKDAAGGDDEEGDGEETKGKKGKEKKAKEGGKKKKGKKGKGGGGGDDAAEAKIKIGPK